jgi:hypothetical protein
MKTENLNLISAAKGVLQSAGYYVDHLWHVSDVHFLCEQLEMEKLGEGEVEQVFAIASEQFDGETGLSWPQLERALQMFQHRKRSVKRLCVAPKLEALW